MSMQDKAALYEANAGRFKVCVTAPVIDQIPPAAPVEKLLDHQALHAARTD